MNVKLSFYKRQNNWNGGNYIYKRFLTQTSQNNSFLLKKYVHKPFQFYPYVINNLLKINKVFFFYSTNFNSIQELHDIDLAKIYFFIVNKMMLSFIEKSEYKIYVFNFELFTILISNFFTVNQSSWVWSSKVFIYYSVNKKVFLILICI